MGQNDEFDKALGIYEYIMEGDGSETAYRPIVLCIYGIEYVQNSVTKLRKPSVNRIRSRSIIRMLPI